MSYHDQIDSAEITSKAPRLEPGHAYELQIETIREKVNGKRGDYFIADLIVVASTCDKNPVGSTTSFVVPINGTSKYPDSDIPRIKGFLAAAYGMAPDAPELKAGFAAKSRAAVGPEQALRGALLHVTTRLNDKGTFTYWNCTPKKVGEIVRAPLSATPRVAAPVPAQMSLPLAPPAPPPSAVFPPAGWAAHPQHPGWFYRGNEVVSEAALRANPRL